MDEELDHAPLLKFIVDQLELIFVQPRGRQYSVSMLTLSFLWNMTAPNLYFKLAEFFILPTVRRLRQLSQDGKVKENCIDLQYLRTRLSTVPVEHQLCLLCVDEIYTAKKIEYSNGRFYGITEDGKSAKTVLAFLIQSVCCKYKDIVSLVPMDNLTSEILLNKFNRVMKDLATIETLKIIGISMDNAAENRYTTYILAGKISLTI